MHIQDTAAPIIDKLPQYAARSPLVQQINLMRNMGWTMWHDKRYADAYAYWRDSAMVNPRNERSAVLGALRPTHTGRYDSAGSGVV